MNDHVVMNAMFGTAAVDILSVAVSLILAAKWQSNEVPSLSCGDILELEHEYIVSDDDGWIDLVLK